MMSILSLLNGGYTYSNPDVRFQAVSSIMTPTKSTRTPYPKASVHCGSEIYRGFSAPVQYCKEGEQDRIREAILKVELASSPFDTAWVAMVPSPRSPKFPCFPQCLDWVLENQHSDGSWGLPYDDPSLIKDVLSSTLASILALRQWNVGEEHVKRGLSYIGSNISAIMDKDLRSPVGFDIIFPGMINYAVDMGLDLPMKQTDVDAMLYMRNLEVKRSSGENLNELKAYHAYIAEGLSKLLDWREIMKYQKRNGSLFNSPSTTAAAVIHTQDEKALNYLRSLLLKFGNSVPTIYPLEIYSQLCIIDDLERLGISRRYRYEIKSTLDKIYRFWIQNDEEVTSDIVTRAMAFRILRMNGYDVSSDALVEFGELDHFKNSLHGHLRDVSTVLELYKASQAKISPDEQVLEKIESWSSCYLKEELSNDVTRQQDAVLEEVDYALKFPFYANLDRLEHKRHIERGKAKNFQLLKTSYVNHSINRKDVLYMAADDFGFSQSTYLKELKSLESWVTENKLDQLEFARQKLAYCYLSTAATLFPPEMSDARMSWAKNSVLTTVVDDFYDVGGSREELLNLVMLVEKWDGIHEKEFCSKQVEIVFSALHSTVNELGTKASALQNRSVTNHMIEIWLNLVKSMMKETDWQVNKFVPTLEAYMANAGVSFALGPIILPALYFVGPKLSEGMIRDPEYDNLFNLVSMCGRLLNDIQGFEREKEAGKLNSLALRILHSDGSISKDDAKREMERIISSARQELLRLVLLEEGSVVPRACKELFWMMSKVLHVFYRRNDGFSSQKEMVAAVNAVIHSPLELGHLS